MNSCCRVILLFSVIRSGVVGLGRRGIRIGAVIGIEVIKDNVELNASEYFTRTENVGFTSLEKAIREDERSAESVRRCGDDQSYYFEPLNQCYLISLAEFLNTDTDRRIAYGGTRNEYMLNCWQQYRGKLLDIGLEYIGEKMNFVKEMIINFSQLSFNRQAVQVGFMINRKYELISQNGDHYDVLDKVKVEDPRRKNTSSCASVCCVVFLVDTRAAVSVEMVYTSCNNRTRALSYICEAPALL
ncbi:unnamed protein product [Litomosoides sigmodontis]|uniref:Uncharacterized protein n=1 Tax=Litomosoides sigmodontis TaxID=42156 RepID=A0A3P6TVY3_LITSI|nr:unnamed protein product [Litomosoides sigmodontis]